MSGPAGAKVFRLCQLLSSVSPQHAALKTSNKALTFLPAPDSREVSFFSIAPQAFNKRKKIPREGGYTRPKKKNVARPKK